MKKTIDKGGKILHDIPENMRSKPKNPPPKPRTRGTGGGGRGGGGIPNSRFPFGLGPRNN